MKSLPSKENDIPESSRSLDFGAYRMRVEGPELMETLVNGI